MFVSSTNLAGMVVCKYQCQYGPNDLTNVVKNITPNHNATSKKIGVNGKVISSRTNHKGTQNSRDKWDGSIKRGYRLIEFAIKTLYLFKHVSKSCFIQ